MRQRIWLLGLLAALAGCGNDPNRTDLSLLTSLMPKKPDPAAQITPAQMAQAALAQLREPVMLAVLEGSGKTALLVPYGENGAVRTWTTLDRQTVSLRQGRLIATRGLGHDLMSLSAPDPRGGGGRLVLTTLNAANEPARLRLDCRQGEGVAERIVLASGEAVAVRRVTETCSGDADAVNTFWIGPDGRTRQSRQWLGPTAGYLTLQVLRS